MIYIDDHKGSNILFLEFKLIGPYLVEIVSPIENYNVRKLNATKTQTLTRIRLRKWEPNTALHDAGPEGNLQPDDEIINPKDDLCHHMGNEI